MSKKQAPQVKDTSHPAKVRLDKWLWAARFYKTRGLAKSAIDGGKVSVDGQKAKPSKEIMIGNLVTARQGWDDKTVAVTALSDQRRSADIASQLYEETEESIQLRHERTEQRKANVLHAMHEKPNKKERRQRQAMKGKFL
jgi:ribosome-associated heat shock protein Hsp15